MSTLKVTLDSLPCPPGHASQLLKHTTGRIAPSVISNILFVKPPSVMVQTSPPAKTSWSVHPSTVNLY